MGEREQLYNNFIGEAMEQGLKKMGPAAHMPDYIWGGRMNLMVGGQRARNKVQKAGESLDPSIAGDLNIEY